MSATKNAQSQSIHSAPLGNSASTGIIVRRLTASMQNRTLVRDVNLTIQAHTVTAVIGPSGCGKSTFLRCLNRMHEVEVGARVQGEVWLGGENIYELDVNPVAVRRRVGMVFQRPVPFPKMSIGENVVCGLRLTGRPPGNRTMEITERALRAVSLWEDVSSRLREPASRLSAGELQRLCIARALAVEPEVLLMDEPCSALDPIATARLEDLLFELAEKYTIVIVTHNMQQAARVSAACAFFLGGELIESGPTSRLFTQPGDPRTEDYLTGRFG